MNTESKEGLTALLSRLPVELLLEIYALCLPPRHHFLDIQSEQPEFKWLTTSRAIFVEAAPLVYSKTALYFDVEPLANNTKRQSLVGALAWHAQTHYGPEAEWAESIIRTQLVEKVMIEVWCASLDSLDEFLSWFASETAARYLRRFEKLEELSLSLRDVYLGRSEELLLPWGQVEDDEVWETALQLEEISHLRLLCRKMRRISDIIPTDSKVRWSLPGAVLPEVSFLRKDIAEQQPTERETIVSRFMDTLWRFVRVRSTKQLDYILGDETP